MTEYNFHYKIAMGDNRFIGKTLKNLNMFTRMQKVMKIKQNIVLIFIVVSLLFLTNTVEARTGTVTSTSIRLRKEASTSSEILETILNGEKVEIISEENGWYKVKYANLTGYLSKDYIKAEAEPTTPEEPTENEPQEPTIPTVAGPQQSNKKLYILPLVNSTVIYEIKAEENITTLQKINNWNYVEINNMRGWVIAEQIQNSNIPENNDQNTSQQEPITQTTSTEPQIQQPDNNQQGDTTNTSTESITQTEQTKKVGYVSVEQVNFRKDSSMESTVIDTLPRNTQVEIIETTGEWSKVKHNGKEGYIATRYLSANKVEVSTRSSEPRTTTENNEIETVSNNTKNNEVNTKQEELVKYAKQFLGSRYVHGGASPSGFDCSGFTYYVYKHFGYNLSRSSSAQSKNGTTVNKADLQIGDLIFFSHYKTFQGIGHVGIYIGNNQFIHASSEKTGVIITSLNSGNYPKRYVTAKRIF